MSNTSIKQRIEETIKNFKADEINIAKLKDSFELNSQALEMMPYEMIKEIDDIEYQLTVSQFSDEEDCDTNIEDVLLLIESWLKRVPQENAK